MIDQASVFAERYKSDPRVLQASVMGQGTDPSLDPYTALRALQLIKESNAMQASQQAQGPTSAPSLASQAVAPQGLAAMMPMGAPAGQMPQQGGQAPQAPQAPAMQASGGLAGLPTPDHEYAQGGIVAFQSRGYVDPDFTEGLKANAVEDDPTMRMGDADTGGSTAGLQQQAFGNYSGPGGSREALAAIEDNGLTREEEKRTRQDYADFLKANAGPDIYAPAQARLTEREAARAGDRRSGEGLALLHAAGAILKGNTLARGASEAFPAYASQMAEVKRADSAEQRSIEQMQFALADAQRKERKGDIQGAQAAMETARKAKADANRFKLGKAQALATLDARVVQSTRPSAAGAGGPKLAEQLAAAEVAYRKNPTPENRATVDALSSAASKMKSSTSFSTSDIAPTKAAATLAPVQQRVDAAVATAMKPFATMNSAYRKAVREKDTAEAQRLWNAEEAKQRAIFSKSETAAGGKGGGSGRSNDPNVINLDDQP